MNPFTQKSAAQHDLIFYARRSTPQVVERGAPARPKKGYGAQTRRRAATASEERTIAQGRWVRVDAAGRTPRDKGYTRTRYRPQLAGKGRG